jgi:hypothetical protein
MQQIHVGRMFRFLKDRNFRIFGVYLKKPERIEVLSMVFGTYPFGVIYPGISYLEMHERTGCIIPNPVRKPT